MVKIASDSSTLLSVAEGADQGITITPLQVSIGDNSWREIEEMSGEECLQYVAEGHLPVSSQPAIGEVVANYNRFPGEDIINIALADGISGTYNTACMAKDMADDPERITVWNSQSICGSQRYMAQMAAKMAAAGHTRDEILAALEERRKHNASYLISDDFDFLRRGGRLSPLVAYIGKSIKMAPAVKLSDNGRHLDLFTVKRTFAKTVEAIIEDMKKRGADASYKFYVSHAGAPKRAEQAVAALQRVFGMDISLEVLHLGPAFIAQGGPGCVSLHFVMA
ncbi:MAG: DegV family protein [Firmicutes bacterium]|nr:DegV family protein [Bacillota bacterium]